MDHRTPIGGHQSQVSGDDLDDLLRLAAAAEPGDRIEYRDRIAIHESEAIQRLIPWLTTANLAAFAIRVLVRVCTLNPDLRAEATLALRKSRNGVIGDHILIDIDRALMDIRDKRKVVSQPRLDPTNPVAGPRADSLGLKEADSLQAELVQRFERLKSQRPTGFAVFGLEHDLGEIEVQRLGDLIRAEANTLRLRDRHWLLWIVYASELAYHYAGDEYWHTFESETPGWQPSSRGWLKSTFRRFAAEFGGPKPAGSWADAFTIISWPITSAILPTDLQRHLARAMYMARYQLARDFDSLEDLGNTVADSGWHGSSRFQTLLEQPRLLGQIAFALLSSQQEADSVISPKTLERLARDLEGERSAAGWLRGAKEQFDRSKLRLVASAGVRNNQPARITDAQARTSSPEVFFLRRGDQWRPFLNLPALQPLARDQQIRIAILRSRASAPSSDAAIPLEALFRGYVVPVARWPQPGEVLVRFEGLAAGLETALLSAWTQPAGTLLFRVERDGRARQVSSRVMRPSHSYLIASTAPIPELANNAQSTGTDVHLYELRLQAEVPEVLARLIGKLGLSLATILEVAPLLVSPLEWTSDSSAVWLVGDRPILGLTAGRDIALVEVGIEPFGTVRRTNLPAGSVAYFECPVIPVGSHYLHIREVPRVGVPTSVRIAWTVREAVPMSTSGVGPLRVWVDPYSRNLEDLWDGKSRLAVQGNRGVATMILRLARRTILAPSERMSVPVDLPLSTSDWPKVLQAFVANPAIAAEYDESRAASLELDAGNFGQYTLEFERDLPSLRWRLDAGRGIATLVDDGALLPVAVRYSSFSAPLESAIVPLSADRTLAFPTDGGLFIAESGGSTATVLVAPVVRTFRSLADLAPVTEVSPVVRSVNGVLAAIRGGAQWVSTSLPGDILVRARRRHVEEAISDRLVHAIAGRTWADQELASLPRSRRLLPMDRSILSRDIDEIFAIAEAGSAELDRPVALRIEGLYRHATQHVSAELWNRVNAAKGLEARKWAASVCLRLATDPFRVDNLDNIELGVELILDWPTPYKVARAITVESRLDALSVGSRP